jgi:hypothetical protein
MIAPFQYALKGTGYVMTEQAENIWHSRPKFKPGPKAQPLREPRHTPRYLARQLGARTYQGKPCKHGHSGERYISNCCCVACIREGRENNREYINAYCRVRYRDDPKVRERQSRNHANYRHRHSDRLSGKKKHQQAIRANTIRLLYYEGAGL